MYIELIRDISPTVMHGFQNNLAQLFSLRSSSANCETSIQVGGRSRSHLKVK